MVTILAIIDAHKDRITVPLVARRSDAGQHRRPTGGPECTHARACTRESAAKAASGRGLHIGPEAEERIAILRRQSSCKTCLTANL